MKASAIALLLYEIKRPLKESHSLKIVNFEVSIHENIEDAHFCAYFYHDLAYKEADSSIENFPMFDISGNPFRFCLFLPHNQRCIYKAGKSDSLIKEFVWQLYKKSQKWGSYEDVSIELAAKIPEFILPNGYEIMEEGIIDDTCRLFFSGNIRTNSYFSKHLATPYIGKNAKDVANPIRIGIFSHGKRKEIVEKQNIFIKPLQITT